MLPLEISHFLMRRELNQRATNWWVHIVVKSEFDASTTDHPYMVHEVKKLDDVEKFDSNLSGDWDKAVTFATLILPTDFIIPN